GMLGTLAALSVASSAVQSVEIDTAKVRDTPAIERVAPTVEPPVLPGISEPRVAPPRLTRGSHLDEVRLERPEVAAPPLRCPPLGNGGVRGHFRHCREILA
ncbi:MAG: hypothetical protein M8872_07685, partial [marine benthic group bacterium]|nr:hypothetical protein [Gemmatimonadota bacterium]